jgi:hypothetical protein
MYVNHGGEKFGNRNCGLCTIAAILDTDSSTVTGFLKLGTNQSEMIFAAKKLKGMGKDPNTVNGLDPSDQQAYSFEVMKNLVKQVMKHKGAECFVSQGGSWDTLVPMNVQKGLMQIYPIGTKYAVYGCMEMKGLGAHWNYAERTADGVEFKDYQYNDSEDTKEMVSDSFIPPRDSGEESGSYVMGIVLVFRAIRELR